MTFSNPIPIRPGLLHQTYTITDIKEENYRTRTFTLDRPVPAEPGQFVMAWLAADSEIPFSITGDDPFTLTATAVGPTSPLVKGLQVGGRLRARGPIGHGFRPHGQKMLLVGGGFDIGPLLFLARRALAGGAAVDVILAARTAKEIIMVEAFEQAGACVLVTTEDGLQGETGPVTGPLERLLLDPASRPDGGVYAVGPVRMLEEIDRVCGEHKVPRQLSWEVVMRRGRCAMGLCGECELQLPDSLDDPDRAAWLVCLDGPVSHTE